MHSRACIAVRGMSGVPPTAGYRRALSTGVRRLALGGLCGPVRRRSRRARGRCRLPIAGCTARSCRRMVRPRPQRHALPSSAGRRCRLPAGPCRQRFPRPTPMPPRVRCGRFRRNRSNRRSAVAAARVRTCRTWSDRLYRHAKPWPASRARSSPIRPRTAEPDVRRGW